MAKRTMRSFRFSEATQHLLAALAANLSEKDGLRRVTETEVIERALRLLAKQEKVK